LSSSFHTIVVSCILSPVPSTNGSVVDSEVNNIYFIVITTVTAIKEVTEDGFYVLDSGHFCDDNEVDIINL